MLSTGAFHVMPVFAAKGVAQADALTVLMTVGPAQVANPGRCVFPGGDQAGARHDPAGAGLEACARAGQCASVGGQ